MSRTVWKYTLSRENEVDDTDILGRVFEFDIPDGEILDVQMQGEDPRIWAIVDPSTEKETRQFVVYGTGHEIPDHVSMQYIGTVQMQSSIGGLVWHVFEVE